MNDKVTLKIPPADEAARKRRWEIIEKADEELAVLREKRKRALIELEVAQKLRSR